MERIKIMNHFAVVFHLIFFGIILLALMAGAVTFITGKLSKNMSIFNKTIEIMDILLLFLLPLQLCLNIIINL